jgi:hypothetical protein
MASFFVFVIGVVVGTVVEYKFKFVDRVGARVEKWLANLGP